MNKNIKLTSLLLAALLLLVNCAKVETLNLKSHTFNKVPEYVIWFQIAGLDEEHLAMLRFNLKNEESKTSFESARCIGKAWVYNLYDLRPVSRNSFQAQLSSSKNIRGTCSDLNQKPFWSKIADETYQVGIFETGASKGQSFYNYSQCKNDQFSKKFIIWSMSRPPNRKRSLILSEREYIPGAHYYDPSCKESGVCYTNIQNNALNIWKKFKDNNGRKIFILRDYSYLNALSRGKILEAREILAEFEKIHKLFKSKLLLGKSKLLLVTSGAAQKFEFPKKGQDWARFEKYGEKIIYRSSSLLSPVIAEGDSSENFCGIFNESEIGQRIFWTPSRKKLEVFNF
ncbi:MAG: hypothetical protein HN576_13045 [Bacteriovoracaceae bacterium]|nr:hypothetical protein [Bacteriovoracaceae bacterium]